MIYGYGLRKRGHVLRARDGSAKQDVRATRTLGVKFLGIAPSHPGEEPCCGNKDMPRHGVPYIRAHHRHIDGDLTNVMYEHHVFRMTQISLFAEVLQLRESHLVHLAIRKLTDGKTK